MLHAVPSPTRDIVVVHSSDLHIDHDYITRLHGGDGTAGLSGVLTAARDAGADVVVLAADTFDCHRVPDDLLARAAEVIAAAALPVVLLPGNHDPAVPDAVYRHGVLAEVDNLHVLGVTHDEAVCSPRLDLEIWAARTALRRHDPFERVRPRSTRADRGRARTLRADPDRTIPAASVVADRRRGARSHRRRLYRARALEPGGEGQRRRRLLLGSPDMPERSMWRAWRGGDVAVRRAELNIAREPSAAD